MKAVFHKFLRIPQNAFPIMPSRVNVESGRTRAQSIQDDFLLHRWKFRLNIYRWNQDKENWFTGIKAVFHNFLRIPQNTFPIIQSIVFVESGLTRAQTIPDEIILYRWNFSLITIRWNQDKKNWFTRIKAVFHNFCGFRKIRFELYSRKFMWNLGVLGLKRFQINVLISLKVWFNYHSLKAR